MLNNKDFVLQNLLTISINLEKMELLTAETGHTYLVLIDFIALNIMEG